MRGVDRGSFENGDGRAVVSRRRMVLTIIVNTYQFRGSNITQNLCDLRRPAW